MLDLTTIADRRDEVARNCADRGASVDLDRLLALRDRRAELIQAEDALRHEQKQTSAQIPEASSDDRPALIAAGKAFKGRIAAAEAERKETEAELRELQAAVPNFTHPDTPVGGESAGRVLREVGDKPAFDFEPSDHVELAERHDLIDFAAGAKVAGAGFYFLKNEAAVLELALCQYAMRRAIDAGWTPHTTPDLARTEILAGTGFNPRGEETQIYSVAGTDLSLVATAEIPLGGTLAGELLDAGELPRRLCGLSHCFRTEAGAYGKATRGIYRVHQFTKVELFAFCEPDLAVSGRMHEEILTLEEQIFTGLGLPYRVLDIATGDLGASAYRKFDLEAWMPGRRGEGDTRGDWGEVTSCSNCTDYQARRLDVRRRNPDGKGTDFVHTLNGTAVAVSRALIALLENGQRADGSVVIPDALVPWCGFDRIDRGTD